jgi:hypothetical protein
METTTDALAGFISSVIQFETGFCAMKRDLNSGQSPQWWRSRLGSRTVRWSIAKLISAPRSKGFIPKG